MVDVEGTGSSWRCSKCNEAVSKDRVDQVRYHPNPHCKMHDGETLNDAVSKDRFDQV